MRHLAVGLCVLWPCAAHSAGLVCDRKLREVRLPFAFVAPTQAIEVFGCSPGGPTHETVITFRATGKEIAEALTSLGVRDESFWQVSGKEDFFLTQGDRLLILLRWEYAGRKRELPAEDLLWRSGEDLPELLYGFSYTGRKVQVGDPPRKEIPDVVEITMGGTGRQSAVTSLLLHPSAFPNFLAEYVSPLELNPRYREEIVAMAEAKKGGTLVLRPTTEEELLAYRLEREPPLWGYGEILQEQVPLATQIDHNKKAFAALRGEIAALLARADPSTEKLLGKKLGEARALAWKTASLYVKLYEKAWRFSEKILKDRLSSFQSSWAKGYRFLLAYLPERVALEELKLKAGEGPPSEETTVKIRMAQERCKELQALRELPMWREQIRFLKGRLKEAEAEQSPYLVRLFQNEIWKSRVRFLRARCEAEKHRLGRELYRLTHNGSIQTQRLQEKLAQLKKETACLNLEEQLCELTEKIRWEEEDAQSENPARRAKAKEKLAQLRSQEKKLKEEFSQRGCVLHKNLPVEEEKSSW